MNNIERQNRINNHNIIPREKILREQQEINKKAMERKERERQKAEQERRKEREEEEALEQVNIIIII